MADLAVIDAKESAKAYQAFVDYVNLGPDRSLAKLANKYGKSSAYVRQLEKWSSQHSWQTRLKQTATTEIEESLELRKSLYVGILREYYRRFGADPAMIKSVQLDALHGVFDRVKPAEALHIIGELTSAIRLIGVDPDSI